MKGKEREGKGKTHHMTSYSGFTHPDFVNFPDRSLHGAIQFSESASARENAAASRHKDCSLHIYDLFDFFPDNGQRMSYPDPDPD